MRSFTPCVLIILASTWGCNQTACIDDPKFREEFQNCMTFASMIARGEYGLEGFDSEQESKLIGSLEALTKHKSKIKLDHGIAWYKDASDFKEDSVVWVAWYERNKCTMTIGMAGDTLAKYREPLPDYSNPKVLKRIEKMYSIEMRDSVRYLDSTLNVKYQLDWPSKLDVTDGGDSR